MAELRPGLVRGEKGDVIVWHDPQLAAEGVVVAFSERGGGVSRPPFGSLNLAAHVGDDPAAVDQNRARLVSALGLGDLRDRLVTADQVHGSDVAIVSGADAGCGAFAAGGGAVPIPSTDALVTRTHSMPLLLLFADCVPVVLVAPGPTVAVAHAGWRGALDRIPGKTAAVLADVAECGASEIRAYVGPAICPNDYAVDERILSQFCNSFGTVARAESGGLDLGAVVSATLTDAGVESCMIARLGVCTAEATGQFFSYRAEGRLTGRHGALACIVSSQS